MSIQKAQLVIWLATLSLAQAPPATNSTQAAAGDQDDCGFSRLDARHVSHFAERLVVSKLVPDYPADPKVQGRSVDVSVRILVDREGRVEKVCPAFGAERRRPERVFIEAAKAAALRWIFKPNFGLEPGDSIRFKYVQDTIVFRFVPPQPAKPKSPREPG